MKGVFKVYELEVSEENINNLKKFKKSQGGLWEFPEGKIEPNETRENAIIRKIKEELELI